MVLRLKKQVLAILGACNIFFLSSCGSGESSSSSGLNLDDITVRNVISIESSSYEERTEGYFDLNTDYAQRLRAIMGSAIDGASITVYPKSICLKENYNASDQSCSKFEGGIDLYMEPSGENIYPCVLQDLNQTLTPSYVASGVLVRAIQDIVFLIPPQVVFPTPELTNPPALSDFSVLTYRAKNPSGAEGQVYLSGLKTLTASDDGLLKASISKLGSYQAISPGQTQMEEAESVSGNQTAQLFCSTSLRYERRLDPNEVVDTDGDGVFDGQDNCPSVANPDQKDSDSPSNSKGDLCEDRDGNGIVDALDYFTLTVANDTFETYEGIVAVLSYKSLLANDTDSTGNIIEFKGIDTSSAVGGSVSFDNNYIRFTPSGSVGDTISFTYTAANSVGVEQTGTVTGTLIAAPSILPLVDIDQVQQDESVVISASSLLSNDSPKSGLTIADDGVINAVGGTVSKSGNNITFTATSKYTQPASFQYVAKNDAGDQGIGTVLINITKLPQGQFMMYGSTAEAQAAMSGEDPYVPPTPKSIFDNWNRFGDKKYYPGGKQINSQGQYIDASGNVVSSASDALAATGEGAAWVFDDTEERFRCTQNTNRPTGFVSTEPLENYTHQVTVSSSDSDNDMIGVIIAYNHVSGTDGSTDSYLAALRTKGGVNPTKGWGIYVLDMNVDGFSYTPVFKPVDDSNVDGNTGGWSSSTSTIRVVRSGDIITVTPSLWNNTTPDTQYKATVDLSSGSNLTAFRGPKPYGYMAFSQNNSTFTNITISGGVNRDNILDIESGKAYQWNSTTSQWVESSSSILNVTKYPRDILNPETGKTFSIDIKGNITKTN